MRNAIIALILFITALGGLALLYGKFGQLSFWKLAAKFPEQVLNHVSNDPAWVVLQASDPIPDAGFTGPFLLIVPSLQQTFTLYAREDQIEESQQRFIKENSELLPQHAFPYVSLLALLYPVVAILSMAETFAPPFIILGYGFANLGYLLSAASVIPGHFHILNLDDRIPTFIAAVIFWVIGVVLSNVPS